MCCSFLSRVGRRIKQSDQFDETFFMKIKDDQESLQSWMGSFLTIFSSLIVIGFIYTKFVAWENQADIDIITLIKDSHFDYNEKFSSEQGLFVAAALTEYNTNRTITEDKRYGELNIELYSWADNIYQEIHIHNHFCSDEELGLAQGANTIIYPTLESSKNEVDIYSKKFKCINKEDLVIWGDYNSQAAQQIAVKFRMCEGDGCKTKEEIMEWLSGKFIVLLYNQIRFD